MSQFRLSAELTGHEDDVKALVAPFNDTIVSASRDSTVRVWALNSGVWNSTVNFTSNGFVNSLAFDKVNTLVVSGGQDGLINVTDLYSSGSIDAKYVLIGHSANVCCLDTSDHEYISGSWDSTAKIWSNNNLKYELVGHNASVWDVKIIGENKYLTSSADRTIKVWDHDKVVKTIVGHRDVVRGLALLPNGTGFASTSNDCTVRVTTFEGDLIYELSGHDSFVYDVAFLSNGDIVTSGEDRTVRIWRNGKAIQVITLPCISVWSVSVLPNDDIVAGGSDNKIRIFSREESRHADPEVLEAFQKEVESIAINAQSFDESKASGAEALKRPGKTEGQVIVVKSNTGINEAHQWSEGQWVKIGEVVSGATSEKKQELDGKQWDFVFDVDVKDGEPPLKLPYNINENPYTAATRFLEANELPTSYTDEVVRFITQNTQGVTINQSSDTYNPYADSRSKIVPQMEYLGFTTDNSAAIFRGISKLNQTEKTFTEDELKNIELSFQSKNYSKLLEISQTIVASWSNKLPGFDILRLIVPYLEKPPVDLGDYLNHGLDLSKPSVLFMTFRLLSNVFLNKKWGEGIITDPSISSKILNQSNIDYSAIETKHQVSVTNSVATLILNFSVYAAKLKVEPLVFKLLDILRLKGLELSKISAETAYRISVAYGNLIYVKRGTKDNTYAEFQKQIEATYSEARFKDVFRDINHH